MKNAVEQIGTDAKQILSERVPHLQQCGNAAESKDEDCDQFFCQNRNREVREGTDSPGHFQKTAKNGNCRGESRQTLRQEPVQNGEEHQIACNADDDAETFVVYFIEKFHGKTEGLLCFV